MAVSLLVVPFVRRVEIDAGSVLSKIRQMCENNECERKSVRP